MRRSVLLPRTHVISISKDAFASSICPAVPALYAGAASVNFVAVAATPAATSRELEEPRWSLFVAGAGNRHAPAEVEADEPKCGLV